jgi:hypothetical protein
LIAYCQEANREREKQELRRPVVLAASFLAAASGNNVLLGPLGVAINLF